MLKLKMLKFKKILLSLSLCLILLTGSVFATTMTESEIKSSFNDWVSDNSFTVLDTSEYQTTDEEVYNYLINEFDINATNYIYWFDSGSHARRIVYIDLGNNKLESCVVNNVYDDEDPTYLISTTFTFNFSGSVNIYTGGNYYDDDIDALETNSYSSSSFQLYDSGNNLSFVGGLTFSNIFNISSNSIFADSDSSSNIFAGILETMTFVLASITTVMGALTQVDLILFVILASLCISIIYFVVKLLKGFTGNKLVSGKKRK